MFSRRPEIRSSCRRPHIARMLAFFRRFGAATELHHNQKIANVKPSSFDVVLLSNVRFLCAKRSPVCGKRSRGKV